MMHIEFNLKVEPVTLESQMISRCLALRSGDCILQQSDSVVKLLFEKMCDISGFVLKKHSHIKKLPSIYPCDRDEIILSHLTV